MAKNLVLKSKLIIFILFVSNFVFAQETEQTQYLIDSLSAEAKSNTGKVKLEVLAQLADLDFFRRI